MDGVFLLELLGDLHWTFVSVGIVSSTLLTALVLATRSRRPAPSPGPLPAITLLKPFDGVDPDMEQNFWTYLSTPYPGEREVLLCTGRDDPEAIAVAERVLARLEAEPQKGVTARLLLPEPGERPWVTRKVWHMARGFAAATHDIIVNGDSGTRIRHDTLTTLVRTLVEDENTGAVWAPYVVTEASSFGARLTRVAWTATTMNLSVVDGVNRIVGNRPLLAGGLFATRRGTVEQFGGFASCDGFLTEDIEVGRRVYANGWEVVRSSAPVERYLGDLSVAGFYGRQLRWNTILWRFRDPLVLPYPLTMCGLFLAPFTFVAASLAFPERLAEYALALGALFLVRWLYALFLSVVICGDRPRLDTLLLLPVVDAVMFLTWLRAPFVRTIRWRGTTLRLQRGGRVTPI